MVVCHGPLHVRRGSRSGESGSGARWSACRAAPGRSPEYLGDLGGLSDSRELILPDTSGTGDSAVPTDPATYRWGCGASTCSATRPVEAWRCSTRPPTPSAGSTRRPLRVAAAPPSPSVPAALRGAACRGQLDGSPWPRGLLRWTRDRLRDAAPRAASQRQAQRGPPYQFGEDRAGDVDQRYHNDHRHRGDECAGCALRDRGQPGVGTEQKEALQQ